MVDVGLGGGGDDRAGVVQDDVGQEGRLIGPWWGHDQQMLLQRDPQAVPVVRPAQEHRLLARVGDPVPQRKRGADPARAAQRRETAPAQPQAENVGEALAGVQPQVQPDPQVAGAVAGQVAGGQERPRERGGEQNHDEQGDGVFGDHRGVSVAGGEDGFAEGGAGGAGVQVGRWGQGGADGGDPIKGDGGERAVPFGDQIQEPGGLGRLPRDRLLALARPGRSRRQGGAGGAAAGSDRALLEHPGAEPGQGRGRGQGQAQQPQDQPADHGQRGGLLVGQRGGQLLVAGQGPGPDDADQGVTRQGISDRGHGPDGQVPPAGRGGDRVHEHAGPDRGDIQDPGPDRPPAVQGQRDPEAGEHQGRGIGDRGLQPGHHCQPPGGVDHPVLGGETHHRRGRGQQAQPGGGITQPGARMVPAGATPSGPVTGALFRVRYRCQEWQGRISQGEENARHRGPSCWLITHQAAKVILDDYRHGVITAIKRVHWLFAFGSAISCGTAGAHADAQHAAGESI